MESFTLEQASYLAEIIGVIAVVLSLIYLGLQVKQNTRSMRIQTVQDLSNQFKESQASIAHDKDLADIYHRAVFNYEQLDPLEQLRFNLLIASVLRVLNELFFKRDEGAVDESMWHGFKTIAEDLMRYPGTQSVYKIRKQQYSNVFQKFVDELIENSSPREVPLFPELGS